jgi:hypothetical protein
VSLDIVEPMLHFTAELAAKANAINCRSWDFRVALLAIHQSPNALPWALNVLPIKCVRKENVAAKMVFVRSPQVIVEKVV